MCGTGHVSIWLTFWERSMSAYAQIAIHKRNIVRPRSVLVAWKVGVRGTQTSHRHTRSAHGPRPLRTSRRAALRLSDLFLFCLRLRGLVK